jgi:hypothetical protein
MSYEQDRRFATMANGNANRKDDERAEVEEVTTPSPANDQERRLRTPLEIAVNAALEAKGAALQAAGMAGEALGASKSAERAAKAALDATEHLHGKMDTMITDHRDLRAMVEEQGTDVKGIARAIGVKRTYSGQILIPPMSERTIEPLSIRTTSSDTGSHTIVPDQELDRLKKEWNTLQTELANERERKRGAEELLAQQEAEREAAEKAAKTRRDKIKFAVYIGGTLGAGAAVTLGWLLGHWHAIATVIQK